MTGILVTVDAVTLGTLVRVAEERGERVEDLATNAVAETCLSERIRRGWSDADTTRAAAQHTEGS